MRAAFLATGSALPPVVPETGVRAALLPQMNEASAEVRRAWEAYARELRGGGQEAA